jgi:hypothetical protein
MRCVRKKPMFRASAGASLQQGSPQDLLLLILARVLVVCINSSLLITSTHIVTSTLITSTLITSTHIEARVHLCAVHDEAHHSI